MARRRRQNAAFPLRRRAGPARASRLLAFAPLRRRMAPRRMAAGRKRADQILALDPAGGYGPRDARGNCQTALADRARLSGTQAGTRARSLRRTRLARLSPPLALCVAAYGFLVSERSLIPPSDDKTLRIQAPRLSPGYRPRGSADPSRTPHQHVNRNHPH